MKAIRETLEKAKDYLVTRGQAYRIVFGGKDVHSERVLRDLAKFCRAQDTTFHPDPRIHAALEGRREVWLRIQHHLKLDPEQLWKTYGRNLE